MATITKRNGTYRIRVSCGYDLTGKQIMKSTTWSPLHGMTPKQEEKEAQRQAFLFEEKCRSGQVLDSNIKFAEFTEKWFEAKQDELRPKTFARYQSMLPRINSAIGHLKLEKIQPQHLKAFYKNLSEIGIRDDTKYRCKVDFKQLLKDRGLTKTAFAEQMGISTTTLHVVTQQKNISHKSAEIISNGLNIKIDTIFEPMENTSTLSSKTILHHHRLISSILSTAVEWQVIFSNPCERVKPPKVEPSNPKYLDEKQTIELLKLLESEDRQYRTIIKLLLYTGLRRGELLGLEWKDIDFEHNTIHIRRSSLYLPNKGIFEDTTKNETSKRSFNVSGEIMKDLKAYKAWQAQQRLSAGDRWNTTDKLFTRWNGLPLHPDNVTKWFREFIKSHDLPYISLHSLRHTNATLQIASGVPLTTVAKRLGHADTVTTSKIYTHAIQSADETAAALLDNILTQKNKQII